MHHILPFAFVALCCACCLWFVCALGFRRLFFLLRLVIIAFGWGFVLSCLLVLVGVIWWLVDVLFGWFSWLVCVLFGV